MSSIPLCPETIPPIWSHFNLKMYISMLTTFESVHMHPVRDMFVFRGYAASLLVINCFLQPIILQHWQAASLMPMQCAVCFHWRIHEQNLCIWVSTVIFLQREYTLLHLKWMFLWHWMHFRYLSYHLEHFDPFCINDVLSMDAFTLS